MLLGMADIPDASRTEYIRPVRIYPFSIAIRAARARLRTAWPWQEVNPNLLARTAVSCCVRLYPLVHC
jgi:hypothetical protein